MYEIFQELDILLYLSLVMVMNKSLYLIEPYLLRYKIEVVIHAYLTK